MLLDYLSKAFFILEVIVGLGLLIFLHEFGHFLMAKKNKVRVEVFSLGFGQALWKTRRGETEYRISWIPLGGYVKMAGEALTDERQGEPWELTSKGAWPRLQIFTAGALMNLVIAFPIAIFSYVVGRYDMSNEVGVPGVPEAYAGMRPGDVILEVDGRRIESLDKFRLEMVRRANGTHVPVKIERDGREEILHVETRSSMFHRTIPTSLMLGAVAPGSSAERAGLQERDEIVSVDGRRIYTYEQFDAFARKNAGKEVALGIRRNEGAVFEAKIVLPGVAALEE